MLLQTHVIVAVPLASSHRIDRPLRRSTWLVHRPRYVILSNLVFWPQALLHESLPLIRICHGDV
jgi:hypothetical protein